MLKKERQADIVHQLNLHNRILSSMLCTEISVSERTIRRYLQDMSNDGKGIKAHSSALFHSFNQFHFTNHHVSSETNKKIIAQKAIGLIKDDIFIFTTGETMIMQPVAEIKNTVIQPSQKVVDLTIPEKINTLQPIHVCTHSYIDALVT